MARAIIDPVAGRMLLGFAVAVFVSAYSGVLFLYSALTIWMGGISGTVSSLVTAVGAILLTTVLVGTVMLPVAVIAGLPALAVAWWLVRVRGARSVWGFLLVGALAPSALVWLFLPVFYPFVQAVDDVSEPAILAAGIVGLLILAPAGVLAGWVFWGIGVRSVMAKELT